MSRRTTGLTALALCVAVLLCACGETSPREQYGESYGTVRLLHDAYKEIVRGELSFLMEASFRDPDSGETGVLYFLQGEGRYDKQEEVAWQAFDATLLGASYHSEEYFSQGDKVHLEAGEVYHLPTEAQAFFQAFPYETIPLPALDSLTAMEQNQSGKGMLYKLVSSAGQKQLVEEVWKLDLYSLAGIANPDYEKESYGEVTYTILEQDGNIRSIMVELTVSVYKKAGYIPGYTPSDDDYRLDLKITAKVELKNQGETVEIPVYQETSDTASEE